jgi:DNA topoisomerase-1
LWKKVKWGLSAGRVQSVAVRLVVNRERERLAFRSANYWDLKAVLYAPDQTFPAQLVSVDGKPVASGKDFDSKGKLVNSKVLLLDRDSATALQAKLSQGEWTVSHTEEKPITRKPAPPFTTSTLQQEANRKLRLSARETMRLAQSLYEQGYITYMRTDSVHLSQQAITAARDCVRTMYGENYLSPSPRQYATKAKNAQEAHEAIRPAGATFRTPQATGLSGKELALYDLIWKRTIASQMADAKQTQTVVQIKVDNALFRASGKRIDFPGFFRAYVEGSDDPESAIDGQEVLLPLLQVGDHPQCRELLPQSHDTQPPARYTEATLVKTLEAEGIGRPSTYASIIGTIGDRGYIKFQNNALVPTFTAFAVTALLETYFPELVDNGFTSQMEQTLDDISVGQAEWLPYLQEFYLGEAGLDQKVKQQEHLIDGETARTIVLDDTQPVKVKIGKFGAYLQAGEGENQIKANIPMDFTPADLVPEKIDLLLKQKIEGPDQIGIHPETNEPIFLLTGQYGPYVQLGAVTQDNPKPRRASLPKNLNPDSLTLEMAIDLLKLPRILGEHPVTGRKIEANIGQFGPYIVHDKGKEGKEYRSLKGDDSPYTITLDRALELLAQPKVSRIGSAKILKNLGVHPADNTELILCEGKYGNYIKYGKHNIPLPKDTDWETVTLAQAIELVGDKATPQKADNGKTPRAKTSKTKTKVTATAVPM